MNKYMNFHHSKNTRNIIVNRIIRRSLTSLSDNEIQKSFKILNLPHEAKQVEVKQAFISLAKRFHPDSGTSEACMEKFIEIENAFRILSKHITGKNVTNELNNILHDIRHIVPQHRQYLSYEGMGHGTPFQRQKQWSLARAQKAAENVMEHHLAKSIATDETLMKKENYGKKHDIKTKYGFDRLVEDLIQESISKGEFEHLSGKGKQLKDQYRNPFVDFTTQKINEVMINNGFTPEWIILNKEIHEDIKNLKKELFHKRQFLGPYPLSPLDKEKWKKDSKSYEDLVWCINKKITNYNLIVPLINKQKFLVDYQQLLEEILKIGDHYVKRDGFDFHVNKYKNHIKSSVKNDDFVGFVFKMFSEIFSFGKDKKNQKEKLP